MPTAAAAASPASAPAPAASPFSPLRIPFFRMLWLASFVSNIGTWMQNVGAVGLMTELTPSPVLVALLQTASALPVFLLSLPAGALADLVDRRRMLLFTQAWMAAAALLLSGLTFAGLTTPWLLLSLTFLLGLGGALNNPVWQTVTPELVPRAELPQALALNSVSFNLARAAGPALGGLLLGYFSAGAAFLLNGLSFLATIYMVWRWQRAPQPPATLAGERVLAAIRGGLRYARFAPPVQFILLRGVLFTLGASALLALLPAVVARHLHLPTSFYSLLLSCMGLGAVLGAVLMPRLAGLTPGVRVAVSSGVFVLGLLALAYVGSRPVLAALLVAVGLAWMLALNSLSVGVQTVVPRWVQARIISLYLLAFQGGMAVGSVAWGAVAGRWGLPAALLGGAGWLLLSLVLGRRFPLPAASPAAVDLSPARPRQAPVLAEAPAPDAGPVIVTTTYRIRPADRPAFLALMDELARIRRREGAIRVGTYADLADPTRIVEYFMEETWDEHLQQHQRGVSRDEAALKARLLPFHQGPEPPAVAHLLALHAQVPAPQPQELVPGATRLVASTAGETTG